MHDLLEFDFHDAHCYDPNEAARLKHAIHALGADEFNTRVRTLAMGWCVAQGWDKMRRGSIAVRGAPGGFAAPPRPPHVDAAGVQMTTRRLTSTRESRVGKSAWRLSQVGAGSMRRLSQFGASISHLERPPPSPPPPARGARVKQRRNSCDTQ